MEAVIYRRGRSSTQSGKARSEEWVLEPHRQKHTSIDPLTGWHSSKKPSNRLVFKTPEQAEIYAKKCGLDYILRHDYAPKSRKTIVKSYTDNFKADRVRPWTH